MIYHFKQLLIRYYEWMIRYYEKQLLPTTGDTCDSVNHYVWYYNMELNYKIDELKERVEELKKNMQ